MPLGAWMASNNGYELPLKHSCHVGMAVKFPGANDLDGYWDLLKFGKEAMVPLINFQTPNPDFMLEDRHYTLSPSFKVSNVGKSKE